MTQQGLFRDRKPPYSEDAEHSVLGAMLMDNATIATATTVLDDGAFYAEKNRRIFRAMCRVYDRGVIVDPISLSEELIAHSELEAAGGKEYIGFLVDVVPTAASVEYHAAIVRDKAVRRQLIATLVEGVHAAYDESIPVRDLAAELQSKITPLAADPKGEGFVHVKDDLWPLMESLEQKSRGVLGASTVYTGYPEIDDNSGGLQRGELVFLCGVPGGLKTAAATNMMLNVARDTEYGAAIVSAEMMRRRLHERNLARLAQVSYSSIRAGTLQQEDFARLAHGAHVLSKLPLWADQTPQPTIASVVAKCRHLKDLHPTIALFVVDYVQLLTAGRDEDNRSLELSKISYTLAGLAKELDVLVLATCQVDAAAIENRSDKRPRLGDLRWSQAMREAAHWIGLCYRDQTYNPNPLAADTLEVNFAKARDAEPFKVLLNWTGQHMHLDSPKRRAREKALMETGVMDHA